MTIKQYYSNQLLTQSANASELITVASEADLRALPDGVARCLLLDLVLNRTLDYEQTLLIAMQKLTPGGELLVMLGSIAPEMLDNTKSFWGFTLASANYIFGKHFASEDFKVFGYGNVLVGRILLTGGSAKDLKAEELAYVNPYYPVYVGVTVIKK